MTDGPDDGVAALGLLQDQVRAALYRYIAAQDGEVSRNAAAAAVGVPRGVAAFHLDKLAEAGLLEVSFRRLSGRTGPGAGRPAKLYRRATTEVIASVPPRAYTEAAELLAAAVEEAGADATLQAVARRAGEQAGRADRTADLPDRKAVMDAMRDLGYEPYQDGAVVRLRNCPFRVLSDQYPPVICGMNQARLAGYLTGLGAESADVRLDPTPGQCCVAISF